MTTQLLSVPPAVVRAASRNTSAAVRRPPPRKAPYIHDPGSWRYQTDHRASLPFWIALGVSGVLHAFTFLGFNDIAAPPVASGQEEEIAVIFLEMPPIEELDEPDEVFDADAEPQEELDASAFVPTQSDVPSVMTDATFVQELDLRSLLPKPEFDSAAVMTIPPRIAHGRVNPNQVKDLFDLADLDRAPVPLLQRPPVFPRHLKNEVSFAEVVVDFIVGADGKVPWAKVYSSSHRGFEDAAILGVSQWQFRPGMKNGKRVATRMRVPLHFRVIDED